MLKSKKILWALGTVLLLLVVSVPLLAFASGSNDVLYGDVNGDAKITLADVVALREKLASGKNEAAADVDGDGVVSLKDLMILRNYFASYNYTTGTSKVVLGEDKASYQYTSGDGAVTSFYDNADSERYSFVCSSYINSGYSVYCSRTVQKIRIPKTII